MKAVTTHEKTFSLLTLALVILLGLVGCGQSAQQESNSPTISLAESESQEEAPVPTPAPLDSSETSHSPSPLPENTESNETQEETAMQMNVNVNGSDFTATLEQNTSVDSLVEMLRDGPLTLELSDYAGFEKVGPLGTSLPTSNQQTTTQAGDIVLYQGDQIVMFYGSNSWSYTRLGHIDDLTGWEEALGSGDVTITFSLED